jgi:hypothetical protein
MFNLTHYALHIYQQTSLLRPRRLLIYRIQTDILSLVTLTDYIIKRCLPFFFLLSYQILKTLRLSTPLEFLEPTCTKSFGCHNSLVQIILLSVHKPMSPWILGWNFLKLIVYVVFNLSDNIFSINLNSCCF